MDFWTVILLLLTLGSLGAAGFMFYLLRRADLEKARLEDFVIRIGQSVSDFRLRIDSLFEQSIHYYDETIYAFVDETKKVKQEIDAVLGEYDDLREYIIPELTKEEKQEQQEKELIGIVRNYPITRSIEAPK